MAHQKLASKPTLDPPSVFPLPIIGADKGFSGFAALTGAEQASVSGFDLEPPDQGLCTDGKVVLEAINLAASIYDASSHKTLAGPVYLNTFFGVAATDFTTDPRCYYDAATQRRFVTLTDLGPASGVPTDLLLAVSHSSDPTGTFSVYKIDTTDDGFLGVCPCFGDQPLIGADDNGFYISTNSYGATALGGHRSMRSPNSRSSLGSRHSEYNCLRCLHRGRYPFPLVCSQRPHREATVRRRMEERVLCQLL